MLHRARCGYIQSDNKPSNRLCFTSLLGNGGAPKSITWKRVSVPLRCQTMPAIAPHHQVMDVVWVWFGNWFGTQRPIIGNGLFTLASNVVKEPLMPSAEVRSKRKKESVFVLLFRPGESSLCNGVPAIGTCRFVVIASHRLLKLSMEQGRRSQPVVDCNLDLQNLV